MSKSLMVILGFFEFIIRIAFALACSLMLFPLLWWVLNDEVNELITPKLWENL